MNFERPDRSSWQIATSGPSIRSSHFMSFADLGLAPELLRAVAAEGYTEPTPVQAQAIPHVLARRDVLAGAQTGTGKTAAFVLPILQLLNASRPTPRHPIGPRPKGATGLPIRCLVLTPTRELALQVEEFVRTYGKEKPIRSTTVYGGVGYDAQIKAVQGGPEIVVATPGRLLDIAEQGKIDLRSVEILVLDEADRMLDMGFIRDIRPSSTRPTGCSTWASSATSARSSRSSRRAGRTSSSPRPSRMTFASSPRRCWTIRPRSRSLAGTPRSRRSARSSSRWTSTARRSC
jgi:superfamily II DNA/RNA helicase